MTLIIFLLLGLAAVYPTIFILICVVKFFLVQKEDAQFEPNGHQSFFKETLTWLAYLIFSILFAVYAVIKTLLTGRPGGGAEEEAGDEWEEEAGGGKYTNDAGNRR